MSQTRELTKDEVKNILSMEQPSKNKKRIVRLDDSFFNDYFDADCTEEDIRSIITSLLDDWKNGKEE